ncbi:tumor suppressor candidate gene 1 protein [Porphyrio hochstetteri]
MWRMRVGDGRWRCSVSPRRGRAGLAAAGSGRLYGAGELVESGGGEEDWRGQSRGSVQQLAERYVDLAACHSEALRQREERERHNARLRQENLRLRQENRRLRRENRCLFNQALQGPDPDKPTADEEVEALRVQVGRLQQKYRRALLHLRRCRSGSELEGSEVDDTELNELLQDKLLEDEQQPSPIEQLVEKSLVSAV